MTHHTIEIDPETQVEPYGYVYGGYFCKSLEAAQQWKDEIPSGLSIVPVYAAVQPAPVVDGWIEQVRAAIEQALDDGLYIRDDGTYYTPSDKPRGGGYCAHTAGMLVDALALLPPTPQKGG